MPDHTRDDGPPPLGANRPTALFATWLFVGVAATLVGLYVTVDLGLTESWLLLGGGVLLVAYVLREWFVRGGGDFVDQRESTAFAVLTAIVLLVTLFIVYARVLA
ncbi:MAG: hypothetical protein ABEJ70_04960 [Halobacteriaceae archaeon]